MEGNEQGKLKGEGSLTGKLNNLVKEGIQNPDIFRGLSDPEKRMTVLENLGFTESERELFKKTGKLSVEHLLRRPVDVARYEEFIDELFEKKRGEDNTS